ncbi:crotonase/enoyl-CoA hydratase family protein [Sneathiella marina]|uniref:Crotonase/enoyl-CoA hydratase family protein n=1 Tax=Sneathiella marina TaxID=2950108 RepID=A0ABY4W3L0_9PROT|nr:crotonase/enoyl-CoA hydratase family protein [Sneathiella marina]USG61775.1 crotonase/enoyl-CoA hydratase family protein [Sneathiella marina]
MALIIENEGPITIVKLNRPQARNAVDPDTAMELRAAFKAFDEDNTQSVAILTGANGIFCAGFDLKVAANEGPDIGHDPDSEGPMGPTRMLLSKPVIAAVEGYAVAGGLELALWCDLRVASQTAVFGVFCRRWGVPLIDGGTVRLPRLIGQSRAMDMVLTGRPVEIEEAYEFGLANRKVAAGQALAESLKLAHEIAKFPQLCLRADRMSAHQQWNMDFPDALVNEAKGGLKPLKEETQAGAARFAAGKGRGGDFNNL